MFDRTSQKNLGPRHLSAAAYMPGGVFDMAVASVFINILGLATPLALLQVFDRIIPNWGIGVLVWLVIGVASALVLEALLHMGRSYVGGWMGARFEHMAGCGAVERLFGASVIDFERMGAGAYLERLNALGPLREFYAGQAVGAVADLPFVAVYLGAIAYLAGPLVAVPVVLMVLFCASALALRRIRRALETRVLADDRRFGFLIEVLGGIHTVKGLAMEEQMLRRYERLQETCTDADYDVALRGSSVLSLRDLFSQLVLASVAGVGSIYVISGDLTVGGLVACIVLAGRAAQPLEVAAGVWTRFQGTKLARERLRQIFEIPLEQPADLPALPPIQGAIDLEGLSFGFGRDADGDELPPLFEGLNLHVDPGEAVGIAGGNASGKTTLLYLMMGVLQPTSGVARIDGFDLREYDPESVRRQVAYLPQEGVLFSGTVLDNLTMFREERAEDALGIAKLFGLDDIVAHLPDDYDTQVGEGVEDKLPQGIKQRIAIARALVDKPRVLLFDEANSFMDGAGDAALLDLLSRLKGRVTLVIASQRPSTLGLADRVYDIHGTGIFERPPPESEPAPDPGTPAEQPEAT